MIYPDGGLLTYSEALIYTTSEGWIDFLADAGAVELVNFWTKDLRNLRLAHGAPFFFKRARSGSIVGYGRYNRKLNMTIGEAWKSYGVGNGAPSLEAKIRRAGEVLGIKKAGVSTKIGCIELEEPEFFPKQVWVPLKELGFGPSTAPQYVTRKVAERILQRFQASYERSIESDRRLPGGLTLRTTRGRTFQQAFRKIQLADYGEQCAMCEVAVQDFLVGSHIVRVSDDLDSATDPANGMALCLAMTGPSRRATSTLTMS